MRKGGEFMTAPDCPHCRDEILSHFRDGTPLGPAAREHYAGCADCMTEVTALLSQRAVPRVRTRGGTPSAAVPDAARRALEHGRQVFAREFGREAGPGEEAG
jgi:hypothetical protein